MVFMRHNLIYEFMLVIVSRSIQKIDDFTIRFAYWQNKWLLNYAFEIPNFSQTNYLDLNVGICNFRIEMNPSSQTPPYYWILC